MKLKGFGGYLPGCLNRTMSFPGASLINPAKGAGVLYQLP